MLAGLGAFTGFLSGLFGTGGGFLIVPMLALAGWPMVQAVGTSLTYVAVVGIGGATHHLRVGNVDRRFALTAGLPAALLAPLGAAASVRISDFWLTLFFAGFLMLIASRMGRKPVFGDQPAPPPGVGQALGLGSAVGFLSGMFGVGGGVLAVPVQVTWLGVPIKRAVGNSLAIVLLTGVAGSAAHTLLGNVVWQAAGALVAGGLLGLAGGTRALARISADRLRTALVVFLYVLATAMLLKRLL